jgi:hypothetical protein
MLIQSKHFATSGARSIDLTSSGPSKTFLGPAKLKETMTKLTTTWNPKLAALETAIGVIEACLTMKKIKH